MNELNLQIPDLQTLYRRGAITPTQVVELILMRCSAFAEHNIWITLLDQDRLLEIARAVEARAMKSQPLYGVPFAIKDNIDLADVLTTAACPDFAYTPSRSATVVERLMAAGAIPIGKTNLDQFATGLVGTRSPYGPCRNAFDPSYISGGSSAGSAVAVALGLASFSLGTDTAGSGRVPAAFNNLIGLKPTRGTLSARGVVPACRTLDSLSIFALTSDDAGAVLSVAQGFDAEDAYSRDTVNGGQENFNSRFCFGIPVNGQLEFFGNDDAKALFDRSVQRLIAMGGEAVRIDFADFLETARLLYGGPWVAERYQAIRPFIERQPGSLHDITRTITLAAQSYTAADTFAALYRLQELKRRTAGIWKHIDVLVTPTAGTIYTIADVLNDPIKLNSNLGYYTNFMNLLDLCGVAVPAGFLGNGLPFGVTFGAPAFSDRPLLDLARRWQAVFPLRLGATTSGTDPTTLPDAEPGFLRVAVCGAHMLGLPLNNQLTDRGGRLITSTRSAPKYRLYALPGAGVRRPGMVKREPGGAIELEVWAIPAAAFGTFVAGIPAPLGIGMIELDSGATVQGFVCESYAVDDAEDITDFGGWRRYIGERIS
ncbi:MAG: allophanate hydrolase [Burkholderiales bacterium]